MERSGANYRLTPAALEDLEKIWLWTADAWGRAQADRYIDAFLVAFERLVENPRLGRACDEIRKSYRRQRVGQHTIFYRETSYGIAIIRLLHRRMDVPRHL